MPIPLISKIARHDSMIPSLRQRRYNLRNHYTTMSLFLYSSLHILSQKIHLNQKKAVSLFEKPFYTALFCVYNEVEKESKIYGHSDIFEKTGQPLCREKKIPEAEIYMKESLAEAESSGDHPAVIAICGELGGYYRAVSIMKPGFPFTKKPCA